MLSGLFTTPEPETAPPKAEEVAEEHAESPIRTELLEDIRGSCEVEDLPESEFEPAPEPVPEPEPIAAAPPAEPKTVDPAILDAINQRSLETATHARDACMTCAKCAREMRDLKMETTVETLTEAAISAKGAVQNRLLQSVDDTRDTLESLVQEAATRSVEATSHRLAEEREKDIKAFAEVVEKGRAHDPIKDHLATFGSELTTQMTSIVEAGRRDAPAPVAQPDHKGLVAEIVTQMSILMRDELKPVMARVEDTDKLAQLAFNIASKENSVRVEREDQAKVAEAAAEKKAADIDAELVSLISGTESELDRSMHVTGWANVVRRKRDGA